MPGTDPATAGPPIPPLLSELLEEARAAGFLGPGPLDAQLRHAEGFVAVVRRLWPDGAAPPSLLDLGSGGGLPGLVVALRWPEARLVLLDANGRRTTFLTAAARRLGLGERVSVLQARAEVAGRDEAFRGRLDGVLARSFGRPAVVAECAAPLLKPASWLVVSEPPAGAPTPPPDTPGGPLVAARWPAEPLRQLGLQPEALVHEEFDYQVLRQVTACPERFPRRDGVPAKRPLF